MSILFYFINLWVRSGSGFLGGGWSKEMVHSDISLWWWLPLAVHPKNRETATPLPAAIITT
jgi:hypothetical protein